MEIGDLDAGAFAFVMATGIVSVAAALQGLAVVSDLLLVIACIGWVALAVALSWKSLLEGWARPRLQTFALVAATAVVGARFALSGESAVALVLWSLAALCWLVLLIRRAAVTEPVGGSLLVVVATESLAVLAALLAPHWTAAFLVVGLVAWALGLAAYPLVAAAILLRLFRRGRFAPDLWIVMGALAIATLAAAELLLGARAVHTLAWLDRWLPNADLATWSLASAMIALLVAAEVRARRSWSYDASRWSFVFPLGMYAVASHALASADGLTWLHEIEDAFFAIAIAAWTLALVGLVRRALPLLTTR